MSLASFTKPTIYQHKKCNWIWHTLLYSCWLGMLLLSGISGFTQERLVGLTSGGGSLGGGTAFSIKTNADSFSIFHKFKNQGYGPEGDLIQGKDGYFYGMTHNGGAYNAGTIFKMSSTGSLVFVKIINPDKMGGYPSGSFIQALDGNFYGMTNNSIFKMTSSGSITVLKTIDYNTEGYWGGSRLVQGTDSNFYGVTNMGGQYSNGTIFKITLSGVFTVLKHLNSPITGGYPQGGLVQGSDGNFYGTTTEGGTYNYGTIFKMTPTGNLTVLKSFDNTNTGARPNGALLRGGSDYFYGVAGGGPSKNGVIFKITTAGAFSIVANFTYGSDGVRPTGSLVKGPDGNLYGMASSGGLYGGGTVFAYVVSGNYFYVIQHLDTLSGTHPLGSLYFGKDGYLYGMTRDLGDSTGSRGTVFKAAVTVSYSVLLRFANGSTGNYPSDGLLQANNGYYYAMSQDGGKRNYGTLYRLCTNGSFSTFKSLDYYITGARPKGHLIQAKDGYYYGAMPDGGTNGYGTIFKMSGSGAVTVLKNLSNDTTGGKPYGSLVQGLDGNFYGMTYYGGASGYGTIFKITSKGAFTVLKALNDTLGAFPYGSLVQGTDSAFYGMTYRGGSAGGGVVFRITASGTYKVLKHLNSATGINPYGSLIQGKDGAFYGLTNAGGTYNAGTLFKLTTTGTLTVLKNFNLTATGGLPQGALVQGSDGTLYGLTYGGGTYGGGTIFKIKPDGTSFAVLRHLNVDTDGGLSIGTLIIQKASPVAEAQTLTTKQNVSKKTKLTASGGTPVSYLVATAPLHGTAAITKDSLTYTPVAGYTGLDSLYYTATWGCQKSAPAKIKISVNATTLAGMQTVAVAAEQANQVEKGLRVLAAPNPSTGSFVLTLQSTSNQPVRIRVQDAVGRLMETVNNTAGTSMVAVGQNYSPGIYYAEVLQGSERVVLKLVRTAP